MNLGRRDFLSISGGALAGAAAARVAQAGPAKARGSRDAFSDFRASLDLDWSYVHMAGLLLASHPRPLREAIEGFRRDLDRNPVKAYHDFDEPRSGAAREAAAAFVGGKPEDIALTDSTTMGLGLLYGGFQLAKGADILATTEDHYSSLEALRYRALRDGASFRQVPLWKTSAQANQNEIVGRLKAAILPATRLLAVTWVHTKTGVKLPIRALAEMVARENKKRGPNEQITFAVDGVHGFGVENLRPTDLGCDFFVAGCHKWLFGPRGTGIVWGKSEAWKRIDLLIPSFEAGSYGSWLKGAPSAPPGGINMSPGGFHSFEHRWALPVAFEEHQKRGPARIEAHIHALNSQLKQGLRPMKHVTLHTPLSPALSSGVTCFEVAGLQPKDVIARLLEKKIIGSNTPYTPTYARLTPGLLNTSSDIDAALAAIRDLA